MKILLLTLLLAGTVLAKDYTGYKTIRIAPSNHDDIKILKDYERDSPMLEFWQSTGRLDRTVDILVPPAFVPEAEGFLSDRGLNYWVEISDIQELIDAQAKERRDAIKSTAGFDYNVYHTYEEIREWVYAFGEENSDIIEVFDVAESYEGRSIAMMKIGKPKSDGSLKKKAVYYQGGVHAREWLSPATVIMIIKQMVDDYGTDSAITSLLDTFDYYVVPQFNADGYVYTWTNDRLWRKNRHEFETAQCTGVDLNRNYPVGWGGNGASPLVCSYTYFGEGPFSEVEHQGVADYLNGLKDEGVDFVHFIDFHTYTQLLLGPWSYSASVPDPPEEPEQEIEFVHFLDFHTYSRVLLGPLSYSVSVPNPPEEPEQKSIHTGNMQTAAAEDAAADLKAVEGADYTVGPSAKTLYEAAGASNDWGYHATEGLNAKYAYVMELRDTGEYGFVIPDSFIDVSGRETYAAVKSFGARILAEYGN